MQHKTTNLLLAIFFAPLLFSCDNYDSTSLVGTWITESCEQGAEFELPGDYWEQGLFKFSSKGEIKVGKNLYIDSGCEILDTEIPPGVVKESTNIAFDELGKDSRSKNGEARGVRIALKSDSFSLDAEGLYIIDGRRVCFSETINFHPSGISIGQLGDAARIDYENCLARYE